MIEHESMIQQPTSPTKKISIQDRSVVVGNVVVVNAYKVNQRLLKQRFAEGRYICHETPHFLLFTRSEAPTTILVHRFSPETMPSLIKQYIIHELEQFHQFKQGGDSATILQGVLDSLKIQDIHMQERTVHVGEIHVMNGFGLNRHLLKQRFAHSGYHTQETTHFLWLTSTQEPKRLLIHQFAFEEMNEEMKHYVFMELRPLGLIKQWRDYDTILSGIVGSFFPDDTHHAWHNYAANTLQRFLLFLSTARTPTPFNFYATIGIFTTWYQRVCELCVGISFLDAGCDAGFLPMVIAERIPFMQRIVGVDIRPEMFPTMRDLVEERNLSQVEYIQSDLLAEQFSSIGTFDTVVAIGVIEHFTEEDMFRVLTNLLAVTVHRLIITVPYEPEPEVIYEHKQLFTRTKLEAVGQWCVQHLHGQARLWCEDCDGGLLLIERL